MWRERKRKYGEISGNVRLDAGFSHVRIYRSEKVSPFDERMKDCEKLGISEREKVMVAQWKDRLRLEFSMAKFGKFSLPGTWYWHHFNMYDCFVVSALRLLFRTCISSGQCRCPLFLQPRGFFISVYMNWNVYKMENIYFFASVLQYLEF